MDYRANKINVKDGIDVDKMENYGNTKEAKSPESRHLDVMNVEVKSGQHRLPSGERVNGHVDITPWSCHFFNWYSTARGAQGRLADGVSGKCFAAINSSTEAATDHTEYQETPLKGAATLHRGSVACSYLKPLTDQIQL